MNKKKKTTCRSDWRDNNHHYLPNTALAKLMDRWARLDDLVVGWFFVFVWPGLCTPCQGHASHAAVRCCTTSQLHTTFFLKDPADADFPVDSCHTPTQFQHHVEKLARLQLVHRAYAKCVRRGAYVPAARIFASRILQVHNEVKTPLSTTTEVPTFQSSLHHPQ
ncbi:unnamed protein product [Ectocarpus sp. 13 AM-2016]